MKRAALVCAALALTSGCVVPGQEWEKDAIQATGGDPERGKAALQSYGCNSCHTIPNLPGDANVGPPLDRIGSRVYVAGVLQNTPDNLMRWIRNPPAVDPKTAMPNVGVKEEDLKDIACYLYTLR